MSCTLTNFAFFFCTLFLGFIYNRPKKRCKGVVNIVVERIKWRRVPQIYHMKL